MESNESIISNSILINTSFETSTITTTEGALEIEVHTKTNLNNLTTLSDLKEELKKLISGDEEALQSNKEKIRETIEKLLEIKITTEEIKKTKISKLLKTILEKKG